MDKDLVERHELQAALTVPEHIWKLTQHYHDLFELKKHWETAGTTAPKYFQKELERCHKLLEELLEAEYNQGGVYRKEKVDEARTGK